MTSVREIYRAERLPIFQNRMFRTEVDAVNCTTGDVALVQDSRSGLVFNHAFDASLLKYDADYQNEQAVSPVFTAHLDDVARLIEQHFNGFSLIEIGCGKGHFLEKLQARGFEITGLDPTYDGSNPSVIRDYFSPQTGLRAEGIVMRHVLEHVSNPISFLSDIRAANGGRGRIYIEVPCLDWIAQHRAWFDVFYEHVNYFRMRDLRAMFGSIHDAGHTFGGQYLYVIADLETLEAPQREVDDVFSFPSDFTASIDRHVRAYQSGERKVPAVWGGASKGVIFTLFMRRRGIDINTIIDINPAKQGKFIATSGLRVCAPDEALVCLPSKSDILVMNSNYLAEVASLTENRFNYLVVDHAVV